MKSEIFLFCLLIFSWLISKYLNKNNNALKIISIIICNNKIYKYQKFIMAGSSMFHKKNVLVALDFLNPKIKENVFSKLNCWRDKMHLPKNVVSIRMTHRLKVINIYLWKNWTSFKGHYTDHLPLNGLFKNNKFFTQHLIEN